ncbi:MAG: tRNA (adenosine(37)-N6)-threonylcarbamoyltransferase complex ATPase subunit type 1 TsaE [Acidimicrobiales bacterium]|nr:tRNA (adenosine(37)-N6)-threonylcarbamoyltransferase complex ATPase subunit type 1 TsaE [Acidimicrobiales bacterium]
MTVAGTASAAETRRLAAALAALAQPGDLVVLIGEMGVGKTAFAQGFAAGLGVTEQVTSPTFTLVRHYQGRLTLHHVDVYRLDRLSEALDLGLAELLDSGGVTLVEWGDVVLPVLPSDYLEVRLSYVDDDERRRLSARAVGRTWAGRRAAVDAALAPWADGSA